MNALITSASFPRGAECDRTEGDVRAARKPLLERIQSISHGHKLCPFCGEDPQKSTIMIYGGGYLVGCDNDNCMVIPQVSGKTLSEAWAHWDRRLA